MATLQNAFENLAVESKQDVMITSLNSILGAVNDIDANTDTLEALIASAITALNDIDINTDDIETKLDAIDAELVSINVDTGALVAAIKVEDSPASSADAGTPVLGVRNDAAAVATSTDGDYGFIALDASGRVGIADLGGSITVEGPLTDAQLRASPVPVSGTVTATGGLTDAQLRATPVPVSISSSVEIEVKNDVGNALSVTGPLTDAELRATPVPVSGTVSTGGLTDTQLRATPVPVSGTVTADAGTGPWPVTDNGGSLTVDDGGGSLTVDGPLTDAQLRATPVPVSGAVTATSPDSKVEDAPAANADTGIPALAVRNDSAATKTSADGDYSMLATDAAGRLGITDLGGSISIDDNSGSITVDGTVAVSNPGLTDTQLRATPVPISGTVTVTDGSGPLTVDGIVNVGTSPDLTDAQLRATPVPVSGTVAVSNPGLTDTQLRATPVPVSGPLTDAQLRATPVPVSGAVTSTSSDSKAEDTPAANADTGIPILAVRNDTAATKTSADGDYSMLATDAAGRVGIADLGGSISIDDNGGSVTVDGTVAVSNPGLTDTQLRATPVPISGTVTSNIGTTGGLALDATLTGGTAKAIVRGGAKGATAAADVTSTSTGANHNALDVSINDASGNLVSPLTDTQLRATPVPVSGTVATGGLTDTQLRATPVPVSISSSVEVEIKNDSGNPLPVSGTVAVSNPGLTDTQLRASAVPVTDSALATTNSSLATLTAAIKNEDAVAASADPGFQVLGVRNDAAAVKTSNDGDYSTIATDSAGRVGITDLGGSISIDDNGGSITVDGIITVLGEKAEDSPHADGDLGMPVFGVRNDAAATRTSTDGDYGLMALDAAGRVGIADLGGSITTDNVVLTDGTQKARVVSAGGNTLAVSAAGAALVHLDLNAQIADIAAWTAFVDSFVMVGGVIAGTGVGAAASVRTVSRAWLTDWVDAAGTSYGTTTNPINISDGKAEDTAAVSGDRGSFILGVRNDTSAAATSADGDYSQISVDSAGRLKIALDSVTTTAPATNTSSNVVASASAVTLLAANAAREMATFYNDSAATCYLKLGSGALATSFNVAVPGGGYYELPLTSKGVYTGIVTGIWTAAVGNMRVGEQT